MGIEPTSSAWKAEVIAIIRCPHPGTRLPDFSVEHKARYNLHWYLAFSRSGFDITYRIDYILSPGLNLVVGEGFEPSKSVTADLQSAPFGRSGTPPDCVLEWCRLPESNWRPTDYKSVALPTELSRHQVLRILGRGASLCNKKIAQNALSLRFCTNSDTVSYCCQSFVQISVRKQIKSAPHVQLSGGQTQWHIVVITKYIHRKSDNPPLQRS